MIVWLASYPRSGNTFFRIILNSIFEIKTYSIYDDISDIGADAKTSEVVGHEFLPEDFEISQAREEKKTYYIKTHEPFDERVNARDKIIYLIRDGRESSLSLMKHLNIYSKQKMQLIDVIEGNTFVGKWSDHVSSWDPYKRENTLLVKFEELIQEPVKFIEVLSEFLKLMPIGEKIPTFEELKKINPKFFRSGKTDAWKQEYTQEEHILFWLLNGAVMYEHGYDTDIPLVDRKIFNDLTINFLQRRDQKQQFSFVQIYRKFYQKIEELKNQNYSFIIYGHGSVGQIIQKLMPKKNIIFIDQKSDLITKNILKDRVYSPKNLPNMNYDKILISVLGREKEIINYLLDEVGVQRDRIMTLNI
jgi:hypothetical protein